ncbi:MAG: hypothetical protein ABSE84_25085 [Isosphaeraceae bacterium]|jgi:predicted DNA-binding protein with PD1-like motif
MHSRELATGRSFGVRFDAGESFFSALEELCRSNGILVSRLCPGATPIVRSGCAVSLTGSRLLTARGC